MKTAVFLVLALSVTAPPAAGQAIVEHGTAAAPAVPHFADTTELRLAAQAVVDSFRQRVAVLGFDLGPAPRVRVRNNPALIYYSSTAGEIVIPWWDDMPSEQKAMFKLFGGDHAEGERLFRAFFHRFLLAHEAGHWFQSRTNTRKATLYDNENMANRIAVAFWRTQPGGYALLSELERMIEDIVRRIPDPTPAGEDPMAFFGANYRALAEDGVGYGYFQFRFIRDALRDRARLDLADMIPTAPAQEPDDRDGATLDFPAGVDAIFAVHDRSDAPGCAVGVSSAGQTVFTKGYGMASLEHELPITPSTAFDIGSVAKQFTALAVLLLEQRQRLSLDDDVRHHVPELPDHGTPITVRDLLQHTSGLRDYGTLEQLSGNRARTMNDFLDLIARQRALNFTPGDRHEYSHSDYVLLGLIIERVAGEPFGRFLEREVLMPIGMRSTRVHDSRRGPIAGRAFAYAESAEGFRTAFPGDELIGGAKLYTTVEDLLRWGEHFDAPVVGGPSLIARMLERPALASGAAIPYAFGLRLGEYRGLRTVHRGGGGTFAVEMLRFPDQHFTVVTLCNVTPSHPRYLSQEVADLFLAEHMRPMAGAAEAESLATPREELTRYAGAYRPVEDRWNILRLIARDGALYEVFADSAVPLTRLADGRYHADGIHFTFTQPTDGRPLRLELALDEPVEVLDRISEDELWQPDAELLQEYTGTFYSDDLGAFWEFVVEAGDLVLRRRGLPDQWLRPVDPGVFLGHFGSYERPLYVGLTFHRDAAGNIIHLVVTTPPGDDVVRDLRFAPTASSWTGTARTCVG